MAEEIDELIERIRKKHLSEQPGGKRKRSKLFGLLDKIGESIVSLLISHKKVVLVAILCLILVFAGIYVLAKDYLTKRQNYPERNVLFRSTSVVYVAGGSEEKGT